MSCTIRRSRVQCDQSVSKVSKLRNDIVQIMRAWAALPREGSRSPAGDCTRGGGRAAPPSPAGRCPPIGGPQNITRSFIALVEFSESTAEVLVTLCYPQSRERHINGLACLWFRQDITELGPSGHADHYEECKT